MRITTNGQTYTVKTEAQLLRLLMMLNSTRAA